MRKPTDSSSTQPPSRLHAVRRHASKDVHPSSPAAAMSLERKRIADRMVKALVAMTPEACEHMLRLAELMALKHPAAPRMFLVRAGLSAMCVNETGGTR